MPEIRPLLERVMERVELRPLTLEGFHDRRDRKRRNQRVAAGVVGIAVFVAAVWVLGTRMGQDTTAPADRPTGNPVQKTAEDVARGFLYATAFFNTDQAVSGLADHVNLSALGLDGIGEFRRWLSFNQATGFQIIPTSCRETGSSSYGTYVRCMFDYHALRSEAIGRGPYSGSYLDVLVEDTPQGWGAIREVSGYWEFARFGPEMLDPFTEWVSTTYPQDAAVMYTNDNLSYRLTSESIRLWEQHTREYVETRPAETAPAEAEPPSAPASAAPDVVSQEMCSDGARARLELTNRIEVRFEVHDSPPGHLWDIGMWQIMTLTGSRIEIWRGASVASNSGDFAVVRRSRHLAGLGVWVKAIDSATGEVCEVSAFWLQ